MTKLQELNKAYEEIKDKVVCCIILYIHMPTGESETIINSNVEEKMKYINKTYNNDLVHNGCKDIYITDYHFALDEDTLTDLNFGEALEYAKQGNKLRRSGWNGKNQYIELATNISYKNANDEIINTEHEAIGNKAIAFVGTSGVQIGWLASQADMLAEDWEVVE